MTKDGTQTTEARPRDSATDEELVHELIEWAQRMQRRDILKALRDNEAVGILFDQNTTRSEGVFADFFGIPAATTPAIATGTPTPVAARAT